MRILICLILFCSPCLAMQGSDWRKDGTILFADAEPVIVMVTDAESGEQKITVEKPSEVVSCVQVDDGPCVESDYFKATVKDVKE